MTVQVTSFRYSIGQEDKARYAVQSLDWPAATVGKFVTVTDMTTNEWQTRPFVWKSAP
jgi:hypothetical protein